MVPAGAEERRTRITQTQRYALHDGGPLAALTDRFFIRSQMRDSLRRTLAGLRAEAATRAGARPPD
jgi:hypothetical protein